MTCFSWEEAYSVGIPTLDEQHKRIVEIINVLKKCIEEDESSSYIAKILSDLARYANEHFSLEEHLFRRFGYEPWDDHAKRHNEFILKLRLFLLAELAGNQDTPQETFDYLTTWFDEHERHYDSKYHIFFKNAGLLAQVEGSISRKGCV